MRVLENEYLIVHVADAGAELCRVYDKKRKQEDLFDGNPAYWNRHAPVLFPFVGKSMNDTYRYQGKAYPMKQHGFARDAVFSCVLQTPQKVVHTLKSNEETLAKYPFPFQLTITHELQENVLQITWKIANTGKETMYYAIGAHPAFAVPSMEGTRKEDYILAFEQDRYQVQKIDPETSCVNPEWAYTLQLADQKQTVKADLFDEDAWIFDAGQIQRMQILYPDGSPYITMTCSGAPSFGIWSKPKTDAPFVCLEPWWGRCDNVGFSGELAQKNYERSLQPETEEQITYSVQFS